MTTIIDKRCTATEADTPEVDSERMRRRQSVREAAARRDLELQAAVLAESDVRTSEERCDQLADQHAMTCQPWQDELAALEQVAIQRIGRREPPDIAEDQRRGELVKLIATATTDLEKAIAEERELQASARRKARKTREGRPPSDTILAALAKPPLASPRLLVELHVAREKIKWIESRKRAAEAGLRIQQGNVDSLRRDQVNGDLAACEFRLRCWEAELAAVGNELGAAMSEAEEVHKALIDE